MTPVPSQPSFHVIAYFPEWVNPAQYVVKDMITRGSAEQLTIINYAFGIPAPDPVTGEIVCTLENPSAAYARTHTAQNSVSGVADDPQQKLRGHFNQLKQLKEKYPGLKVVISLGGWTGSGYFSDASMTQETREKFVAQCLDFFILGNLPEVDGAGGPGAGAGVFDGVDLDWEYPGGNGLATNHSSPQDGPNYVALLAEFRRQFAAIGRPDLLLTMAGAAPVVLLKQYNLEEAQQYLDIFSLMSYDFTGPYAATTGHHTNLCTSQLDPAPVERRHSADVSVHALQEIFHIPPEKIVVGAAFYGKAWTGVKPENNGLFQPGQGMQQGGGSYRRLKTLPQEGYTRYWDPGAQAPYLYEPASGTFWTYDDPESVALKARYVKHWGLGGVMFWEITEDDEQGSLVSAITQGFRAEDIGDPCESGGK